MMLAAGAVLMLISAATSFQALRSLQSIRQYGFQTKPVLFIAVWLLAVVIATVLILQEIIM